MAQTDRQTDKQTSGHCDSMTDPAKRAESVKKKKKIFVIIMLQGFDDNVKVLLGLNMDFDVDYIVDDVSEDDED